MKHGRLMSMGVIAGLGVAMLVGCGASSQPDKTTLTYWSIWSKGEPIQLVFEDAIADFEKETGVDVKVQWQGRANADKLIAALKTNNVPDLVDGDYAKLAPILGVNGENALPLTDAYATVIDGKPVSEWIPDKYLENNGIRNADGEPWILPTRVNSDAIFFNATEHPELVDSAPETWDEFIEVLDELKADGNVPLALDGDIAAYNATWFNTLLMRNLGSESLKDLASDETGESWDDPLVLDAASKVQELVDGEYIIPGYDASKWPAQQQQWANNEAALMFMGSWLPTESASYAAPDFEYSSFPFPITEEGHASQRADVGGFAVPSKADNTDAAQELAAYLIRKTYQDAFGTDAKVIPIREDAEVSAEVISIRQALNETEVVHQQNGGVSYPGYNETVLWPLIDALTLGKISAEEFVSQAKQDQIAYWNEQ